MAPWAPRPHDDKQLNGKMPTRNRSVLLLGIWIFNFPLITELACMEILSFIFRALLTCSLFVFERHGKGSRNIISIIEQPEVGTDYLPT